MSQRIEELHQEIAELVIKINKQQEKARKNVEAKNKEAALQNLKLKKAYENQLKQKQRIVNRMIHAEQQEQNNTSRMLQATQQKISNTLSGNMSSERKENAQRRNMLRRKNGRVIQDSRNTRMSGRPCFSNCEKKSWCDSRGWCDSNYYCTPSNREGTDVEPGVKDQKCIPVHMKSQGGRKKRKTKKKHRKIKRKHRKTKRKRRKTKKKRRKTKRRKSKRR